MLSGGAGLGRTSVGCALSVRGFGRVCPGSSGSRTRCSLTGILKSEGAVSPGSNPSWRGWVYFLVLEAPILGGNADGAKGVFGAARHTWATAHCPDPHKKVLCQTDLLGWADDKYWQPPSRVERIHYSRWDLTSMVEPHEAVSQALTLHGGVRSKAWHPSLSLLGECVEGQKHFWSTLGVSGVRPCALTHLKKPCASLFWMLGRTTNTDNLQAEWSVCATPWEKLGGDALRLAALCRMCSGSRSKCVLKPQRAIPQALTLPGRAGFITWRLKCPFFREVPTRPEAFLEPPGVPGPRPFPRSHLYKNPLFHTRPVGGTCNKYR